MLVTLAAAAALAGFTKPVTAIALYKGAAYVGTESGEVDRVDPSGSIQEVVSPPAGAPISFVAASPYGLAWLRGPGGAIREQNAPRDVAAQVLTIRAAGRNLVLKIQPKTPVRRLQWIQGKVAVSHDFGSEFYDLTGSNVQASSFMPPNVAQLAGSASLWVREQADGTELAVFARPHSVRQNRQNQNDPLVSLFSAFQVGAWQWVDFGGFASTALDAFPDGDLLASEQGIIAPNAKFLVLSDRVSLAENGIVAREPASLVSAPVFSRDWTPARLPAAQTPGDSLWFGSNGDSAWLWNGHSLVQQDRQSGSSSAYFPWSDRGLKPSCFAADDQGLWIGSNHGLQILRSTPGPEGSYAGFVRVPLAEPAPTAEPAKRLTDAIFAWRFADASKAGADGGIMIASAFSAVGLQLPQTAAEIGKVGDPVTDQLAFGDVLVGPKGAAINLGNGTTVEVRGGRVQNGEVWSWADARVRRFLKS